MKPNEQKPDETEEGLRDPIERLCDIKNIDAFDATSVFDGVKRKRKRQVLRGRLITSLSCALLILVPTAYTLLRVPRPLDTDVAGISPTTVPALLSANQPSDFRLVETAQMIEELDRVSEMLRASRTPDLNHRLSSILATTSPQVEIPDVSQWLYPLNPTQILPSTSTQILDVPDEE